MTITTSLRPGRNLGRDVWSLRPGWAAHHLTCGNVRTDSGCQMLIVWPLCNRCTNHL